MLSQWATILDRSQLEAHFNLTASIDQAFAKAERTFYSSRTRDQLNAIATRAWHCNEPTMYQLAMSFAALAGD